MKIAVIGSRSATVSDIGEYLPESCTEIVSGGAVGIDSCASEYAKKSGLSLKEFFPEYSKYGKTAPIIRNKQIVEYADAVIAFWDGRSRGTLFVIEYCKKLCKPCTVIRLSGKVN